MSNTIKISLLASIVLTNPLLANASTELEEAIKNTKFTAEIKSQYAYSNLLGYDSADKMAGVGGNIGFLTGDFYGLKLGATLQAMGKIYSDRKNDLFKDSLDANGLALSEAYVDYTLQNTNLKLGRQFIYTPLVSSAINGKSSEVILKDAFEAYTITNSDLPDTTITAGFINRYQNSTDYNGHIGKFKKYDLTQDGAYTVYLKNTSIENLKLQAQYLRVDGYDDNKDAVFFQADYNLMGHILSAQYTFAKNRMMPSELEDSAVWGISATGPLGISNLGYATAFTSSYKDGDSYAGLGKGTNDTLFTAMPLGGDQVARRGNSDTVVGAIVVPVEQFTFIPYLGKSFANPNDKNQSSLIGDVLAYGLGAMYKYDEHLNLKANWEYAKTEESIIMPNGNQSDKDNNTVKIYASYLF